MGEKRIFYRPIEIDGPLQVKDAITPLTSDGAALGSASVMYSDLFLASGAVINFNNGDVTATHSANTLAFAGATSGYQFDSIVGVGSAAVANQLLTLTNATLAVTAGRALKVSTSTAAPNMDDGYGVVEIDTTITGTAGASGIPFSALSSWVNIPSGTVGAGKYVCAQNNGIYEVSAATVTNAKLIFGMRMQYLADDTDGLRFPFSLNTNNAAITALCDVVNIEDTGYVATHSNAEPAGSVPLFRDVAGNIKYVQVFSAAS